MKDEYLKLEDMCKVFGRRIGELSCTIVNITGKLKNKNEKRKDIIGYCDRIIESLNV